MGIKGLITQKEFKQGGYGICTFLSVMDAILKTKGGDQYFENMISYNPENEKFTVTFPNRDPITLTQDELEDPNLSSTSDAGIAVLEAATIRVKDSTTPFKLYIGDEAKPYLLDLRPVKKASTNILDGYLFGLLNEQVKDQSAIMVGGVDKKKTAIDIYGNSVDMVAPHGYMLTVKGDNMQFENPWDTSQRITISKNEALKVFDDIVICAMPHKQLQLAYDLEFSDKQVIASTQMGATEVNVVYWYNLEVKSNSYISPQTRDYVDHLHFSRDDSFEVIKAIRNIQTTVNCGRAGDTVEDFNRLNEVELETIKGSMTEEQKQHFFNTSELNDEQSKIAKLKGEIQILNYALDDKDLLIMNHEIKKMQEANNSIGLGLAQAAARDLRQRLINDPVDFPDQQKIAIGLDNPEAFAHAVERLRSVVKLRESSVVIIPEGNLVKGQPLTR